MKVQNPTGLRAGIAKVENFTWHRLDSVRALLTDAATGPGRFSHVSAASGLVMVKDRLWVASDDENHLASFHGERSGTWLQVLPEGLPADRTRGDKKADFETLTSLPAFGTKAHGGVLTLGSGSALNRDRAVFLPLDASGQAGTPQVVDLSGLYGALRLQFPELNIEGAVVDKDRFRLLHRGGESGDNALIDVSLAELTSAIESGRPVGPTALKGVTAIDLGTLGGVPLGFTDAASLSDGSLVFTAAAEDTTDPKKDGQVVGSVIGLIGPDGSLGRVFPVKDVKLEGVHAEVKGDDVHLLLVADADDPTVPSPLLRTVLPHAAPQGPKALAQTSQFETTKGRPQPQLDTATFSTTSFSTTAKVAETRSTGWTSSVSSSAAKEVRAFQAELRHYAKLADQGGLRPSHIAVAPFEPGAPESAWFTVKGQGGQPEVVWQLRTARGEVPAGLAAMSKELGIGSVRTAALEGATAIAEPSDVSPRASFGRAMALASQLMRAAKLNPEAPELELFIYTTARYLLNATTPQALAYLADSYRGDVKGLIGTGQVPERWVEKLDRGFQEPYTTDEALAWLNTLSLKLNETAAFVDSVNTNGSPITFYVAGSNTKARWGAGSDMDVLIDTPDKALEQKILEGPQGFYGGANKEEFAILNAGFYWERGPYFGQPVKLAEGTKALKPELVEKTFRKTSQENWGVVLEDSPTGTRVTLTEAAKEKFVREAPAVTEVLYDFSRPTRATFDTKWVTEHWDAVVAQAPELRLMSRQRFIDEGNALIAALLPRALETANVERFFAAKGLPVPQDVLAAVPPLEMDDFLGLTDAAERLFVDFASADKASAT